MKKESLDLLFDKKNTYSIKEATYTKFASMGDFHYHKHYEILYLTNNSRTLCINGKDYTLSKDTIAVIPPLTPHKTQSLGKYPEKRIMINFQKDFLSPMIDVFGQKLIERFTPENSVLTINKTNKEVVTLLEMLLKYDRESDSFMLLLSKLLLLLASELPAPTAPQDEISHIVEFVEKNHTEQLSLDLLENEFHINKFNISRKFKDYTGTTFVKYLTSIRLIHAKKLLEDKTLNITDVALSCGFDSLSSFGRVFKAEVGVSPAKYKKLYLG